MMRMFGRIHFYAGRSTHHYDSGAWLEVIARENAAGYVTDIGWRFRTSIDRRLCTGSAGIARLYLSVNKRAISAAVQHATYFLGLKSRVALLALWVEQGGSDPSHWHA